MDLSFFTQLIYKKSRLSYDRTSALSWFLALAITDGTICSWGLRVAFLSNPDAAVAGCELCCPHRNPNWHIVFVSNRVWFVHGLNLSFLVSSLVKAFFCPLETEHNLFCVSASPSSPLGLTWEGIESSLASPMNGFSMTWTADWAWQCAYNVRGLFNSLLLSPMPPTIADCLPLQSLQRRKIHSSNCRD